MKKTLTFLSGHLSTKENESDRKASSYLKRREQVRKAQRTHRERKDQYFKALESEVLHLKENEANYLKKIQQLEAHIGHLQDTLQRNGIELPTNHVSSLNGNFPRNKDLSAAHAPEQHASAVEPNSTGPAPNSASDDDPHIAHGMEFVLTLEKPCLGHINTDLTKSDEPSGHALTASMSLLHSGYYPDSFAESTPSLAASKTIFNRLTNLSSALVDDSELSPIQAWNYITNQPQAYKIQIDQLRRLAANMLEHITCHGFGAVVEKDVCMKMVAQMMAAV